MVIIAIDRLSKILAAVGDVVQVFGEDAARLGIVEHASIFVSIKALFSRRKEALLAG